MIEGLSHMTFVVRNLDRMTKILIDVLVAGEIYASGNKTFLISREKLFDLSRLWIVILEGEPVLERICNNVAFKISEDVFEAYLACFEGAGIDFKLPRPRVEGEGRSIYFYDDDNQLFKIYTRTLQQKLHRYVGNAHAMFNEEALQ